MRRIFIYDDFNGRIRSDSDTIGTMTCNIGVDAPRNGYKIIEIFSSAPVGMEAAKHKFNRK